MTVYKPHMVYAGMGKCHGGGCDIRWDCRPDTCSRVNWEAMKREFARQQALDFYDLAAMRPLTPDERDAMKRYVDFLPDDALVQAQGERVLGVPQPAPVKPARAVETQRSYTRYQLTVVVFSSFVVAAGLVSLGAALLHINTVAMAFVTAFSLTWCAMIICTWGAGTSKHQAPVESVDSITAEMERLDALIQIIEQHDPDRVRVE